MTDTPTEAQINEADVDDEDEERDARILELAHEQWHKDGEIEIDDDPGFTEDGRTISVPAISEGDDNGAYVRAWVWVNFSGTDLDKKNDEDDG